MIKPILRASMLLRICIAYSVQCSLGFSSGFSLPNFLTENSKDQNQSLCKEKPIFSICICKSVSSPNWLVYNIDRWWGDFVWIHIWNFYFLGWLNATIWVICWKSIPFCSHAKRLRPASMFSCSFFFFFLNNFINLGLIFYCKIGEEFKESL